jgi:hypothetical protein
MLQFLIFNADTGNYASRICVLNRALKNPNYVGTEWKNLVTLSPERNIVEYAVARVLLALQE